MDYNIDVVETQIAKLEERHEVLRIQLEMLLETLSSEETRDAIRDVVNEVIRKCRQTKRLTNFFIDLIQEDL